jgi:hypothetical protein
MSFPQYPKNGADRIPVGNLSPEEQAWYEWLDNKDLAELEKAYFEKVHRRKALQSISYPSFVKVCAAVAVKLHNKHDKREAKALARLEKLGNREVKE